jgi:hypothetical protein
VEAWLGWGITRSSAPRARRPSRRRLAVRGSSRLLADVEQPQAVHLEHVIHPRRDVLHGVQVDAGRQAAADWTPAQEVRADLVDLPDLLDGRSR